MDLKTFSFTKALKAATESSRWEDTITSVNKAPVNPPKIKREQTQVNFIELKHQLWSTLQFEKYIFYFFTSHLTVYNFEVDQGKNNFFCLKQLKGTPSCIGSGIGAHLKQGENIQNTHQAQNNYIYKMVVLVGLQEGFVKVIQIETDKNHQIKHTLYSHKLEQKPIVNITVAEKLHYEQKNICFILLEDSKVFLYNYVSHLVLCIYQPPVLSHDHAISFTLHSSACYFASCAKSGNIIIWELTSAALNAIAHSQDKQLKSTKNKSTDDLQQIQSQLQVYTWKFKPKDRVISVFPLTTLHAASVEGLKWISFMGNLLALISNKGLFRIIALNFQIRDEYITIIEYQIQDGECVTGAQIFPEMQCLICFKSYTYIRQKTTEQLEGKGKETESSTFQDLNQKEYLLKNDNYYKTNFKTLKNCRSIQNIIQQLTFSDDLNITQIKKFQPLQCNEEIIGNNKRAIKKSIRFSSGSLSFYTANKIVMCRNDNGFYVGVINIDEE